MELVICLNGIV